MNIWFDHLMELIFRLSVSLCVFGGIAAVLVYLAHKYAPVGWRTKFFNRLGLVIFALMPNLLTAFGGLNWAEWGLDANSALMAAAVVHFASDYWRNQTTTPPPALPTGV